MGKVHHFQSPITFLAQLAIAGHSSQSLEQRAELFLFPAVPLITIETPVEKAK